MAFQFIHVSSYARNKPKKAGKGKDRKWTVRDIAGEAERAPEHSLHVPVPQKPSLLFGVLPSEAVAEAERRAIESKDVRGRKIRKDAHVLLAGVASHPATVGQLVDLATRKNYEQWSRDTLDWLKQKYGKSLLSVVEHLDEKHPHLHFYVVPQVGPGFNAKSLHDGFKAAESAKNQVEQKRLYCDAMRALQDDFFRAVGARHQQARLGPRRRRLTRAQWLQEQHQLAQISQFMKAQKVTLARAHKTASLIIEKAKSDSQKVGVKFSAFFSGVAGHAYEALQRVERERDAARSKLKAERERREETEKQVAEVQRQLVHERLTSDKRVESLVAIKLLPLKKQLEFEARKRAETTQQLQVQSNGIKQLKQGWENPKPL